MRGRQGLLYTGHYAALVLGPDDVRHQVRSAVTGVTFADLTDAEIAAYADTGEPQRVAGAFTIDGYGGAFVTRITGDPHNVIGISLPLVRQMLLDQGVSWHTLAHRSAGRSDPVVAFEGGVQHRHRDHGQTGRQPQPERTPEPGRARSCRTSR